MYVCKPETKIYFMVGEICLAILNHLKSILNYVCIYKCKFTVFCSEQSLYSSAILTLCRKALGYFEWPPFEVQLTLETTWARVGVLIHA